MDVELIPLEVQEHGLAKFMRIGEEVSEVLERRPASAVLVRVIRPKFVPKDRIRNGPTPLLIGEPAELRIERGLAGSGLVADTIASSARGHLCTGRSRARALDRLRLARGVGRARSAARRRHAGGCACAASISARTPPACSYQAKEKCRTGHFWVLVAPGLHVLFGYSPGHDRAGVDELLMRHQGYLVADAYVVYDHLFTDGKVVEVGCWAHYPETTIIPRRAS